MIAKKFRLPSKKWQKIIRNIPGYDPFENSNEFYFDTEDAARRISFCQQCLVHVEGQWAGKPFMLEPWQLALFANTFGWKNKADGLRRYREVFLYVPRKNGKSTVAAALGLTVLFTDPERGMQIYGAAAEREQASLVFNIATGMVIGAEILSSKAKIYTKEVRLSNGNGFYRVISADASTKHGFNTHCAIIDELHTQRNRNLVDVLTTSMGARTQPLTIYLTTADHVRESICNEKYAYACKVRDGILKSGIAKRMLPIIFEAAKEDDWKSPAIWAKANPNLGKSVSLEFLQGQCELAQEVPDFENTFRRLYLNQRTEQANRWLPMELWRKCSSVSDPLKWRTEMEIALRGKRPYAGLDLGAVSDMTALALFFMVDGKRIVLPYFWVSRERAEVVDRKSGIPYLTWIRHGYIKATEGNVTDYDVIRKDIKDLRGMFAFKEIAVDRVFQGVQLCTQLMDDGMTVFAHGQGFLSMSAPSKELERLVWNLDIEHGNNEVLTWMASNCAVKRDDADNLKPTKADSGGKIDGIIAAIMALSRAMATPQRRSIYETRGIDFLTVTS